MDTIKEGELFKQNVYKGNEILLSKKRFMYVIFLWVLLATIKGTLMQISKFQYMLHIKTIP